MSSRLERNTVFGGKAVPLFSLACALLFHSFAKARGLSPFLSAVYAFLRKTRRLSRQELLGPLFSYSYKRLLLQPLSFDTHTNARGSGTPGLSLHPLHRYFLTLLLPPLPLASSTSTSSPTVAPSLSQNSLRASAIFSPRISTSFSSKAKSPTAAKHSRDIFISR